MKKIVIALLIAFTTSSIWAAEPVQSIPLKVTEKGFEPSEIKVKPGSHVILEVTRMTDATCATELKISEKKIKKNLPLNKAVKIDVGVLAKGKITFACGMDMVSGHIVAE